MDFTPKGREKETSDRIAEALYILANNAGRNISPEERSNLLLASGFIMGQAHLIRTMGDKK